MNRVIQFTLGRNHDNDLVIQSTKVSGKHAILKKIGNRLVLEDNSSRNGTFVNGRRIRSAVVKPDDVVMLSSHYKLDWHNRELVNWLDEKGQTVIGGQFEHPGTDEWKFALNGFRKDRLSIGRVESCDIVIDHPRISRVHAYVYKDGANWVIEDNGSGNGTFVNGTRVLKATIRQDTKVALAGIPVQLLNATKKREEVASVSTGEASIEVEHLSFAVPDAGRTKLLLRDITLSIPPGSFVGLIGPSGSGKTTLMQSINGTIKPTVGSVHINDIDIHSNRDFFKGFIGYVPQDDIIHRELTVGKSLSYNADLRLASMSQEERNHEVNRVIGELSLNGTENTIIGSPVRKGISGGQRKRVNLAQELITRPSILFLDEPCSGLDPKSDMDVMLLLRNLCDAGKTVILTTHNPSQRNLDLMDYLLVLTYGGTVAFFGPPSEVTGYFEVAYPEDIFARLDEIPPEQWSVKRSVTKSHHTVASKRSDQIEGSNTSHKKDYSTVGQLSVLCKRLSEIKIRDSANTVILLLVPVLVGALLALIMSSIEADGLMAPRIRTLYILIVSATFFGILNSARDIVAERAIFRRESRVFLKSTNYLLSKILVLGILCAIQCFLMLAITYQLCDLQGSFLSYWGILVSVGMGGSILGLLVSATVSTETVAMTFVPALLVPQIILGGFVVRFSEMTEITKILAGTTMSRWGFEAALLIDAKSAMQVDEIEFSQTVAAIVGFTEGNMGIDLLVISLWFLAFYLLSLLTLKHSR